MKTLDIKISIVVPLFNEEESLPELYQQLKKTLNAFDKKVEFLFIDDGSTDKSMQVLTDLHKKDSRVRVYQFRRNQGKSAALATGFGARSEYSPRGRLGSESAMWVRAMTGTNQVRSHRKNLTQRSQRWHRDHREEIR